MRIILSRDRASQLDLLLQSLERNAPPEPTAAIVHASTAAHEAGYKLLKTYWPSAPWLVREGNGTFEQDVRRLVAAADGLVTFFCDDDVLFAEPPAKFVLQPDVVCFSMRLGENTTRCYPTGEDQDWPAGLRGERCWDWREALNEVLGDFAYPGSIDGHTFRAADVQRALAGRSFANPTELEDALQAGCVELAAERPLMASYPRSVLCSVPVNQVSEQSQVRAGVAHPQSAEALNARFLGRERIALEQLDFSDVDSAHFELEFKWRPA